jgi:hypothetical protein
VRGRQDFEQAFLAMKRKGIDAVAVYSDATLTSHYEYVAGIAARQRLPSIGVAEYATVGGLVGYGANRSETLAQGGLLCGQNTQGRQARRYSG